MGSGLLLTLGNEDTEKIELRDRIEEEGIPGEALN